MTILKYIKNKFSNLKLYQFIWYFIIINIILFNFPFILAIYKINQNSIFIFSTYLLVFLYFNVAFNILFYKKTAKILSIIILLVNSGVLYFINTYSIFLDTDMMRNVIETDPKEVFELLNFRFLFYIIILGVIPSILIFKLKINFRSFKKELLSRILNIVCSLIIAISILLPNYAMVSSFIRTNKQLQYLIIPTNYITSTFNIIKKTIRGNKRKIKKIVTIGDDAKLDENLYKNIHKKNLLIIVVGEAARAQEFSLDGKYKRNTNQPLEKYNDLISFTNFSSCGTCTAVSVPCMFSHFDRKNFDTEKEKSYWNVMDIFKKLNFGLLWRDNNSGCKGVCKNIETEEYYKVPKADKYCNNEECFDEVMLEGLNNKLKAMTSNNIIITLHQKGSHGPAYYKRVPDDFKKFAPVCETEYFNNCTHEELVNAYDNTIYYTSYFLSKVIDFLKSHNKDYNVAMIYLSDHGQSLGEYGMYLHGAPYIIAPEEQTHIPAIFWISNSFAKDFKINLKCLENKKTDMLSQDYLYHSLLGLFNIKTTTYDKDLDIFNSCRY